MSSATNLFVIDEPVPTLVPHTSPRLKALHRCAQQHHEAIEKRFWGLIYTGINDKVRILMSEHEIFVHDKKFGMRLASDKLEEHVHLRPETNIKNEVEVLRQQCRSLRCIFVDIPLYNGLYCSWYSIYRPINQMGHAQIQDARPGGPAEDCVFVLG